MAIVDVDVREMNFSRGRVTIECMLDVAWLEISCVKPDWRNDISGTFSNAMVTP